MRIAPFVLCLLIGAAGAGPARAAQPAIIATTDDGNLALVLPDPGSLLPTPIVNGVTGLPVGARPHGVGYINDREALVADFFPTPQLFRVSTDTLSVLSTIPVPLRTNGTGTVAVSPDGGYAIFAGSAGTPPVGQAVVIRAPFDSNSAQTPLSLPGAVRTFNTQAIAFAQNGRAFICHTAGVSVLDPPYSSIAFTIAVARPNGSNCVLRGDQQRLIVTNNQATGGLAVYDAPFSASSTAQLIPAPAGVGFLGGLGFSPDGTALLVAQIVRPTGSTADQARLFVLREIPMPPFIAWTEIMLPDAIRGNACVGTSTLCPGFEDIAVNAAGDLALVTGNSVASTIGRAPLVAITSPFDDMNRVVHAVALGNPNDSTHGRGAGSVRFLPPGLPIFSDGFEQ